MSVRPWENYDFKKNRYYDIQEQKTKWEDYLSGKTQQQRENIKTALIVLTAILVVGIIASIIALSLTTMPRYVDEAMNITEEVSCVPFSAVVVLVGGGILVPLSIGIHRYRQPIDTGTDLTQEGLEREEMLKLFSEKGTLNMLKEYIHKFKLDYLVYQYQIEPDEAEQMLRIVLDANDSSISSFMRSTVTDSATKMWVDLRNKICTRRAASSAEQVVNYTSENYQMPPPPVLQPVYIKGPSVYIKGPSVAAGQWVPIQGYADGNWGYYI